MLRLDAWPQLQPEKLHIPMGMILFCVEQVIMACGYRESLMASKCQLLQRVPCCQLARRKTPSR